MKVISWNINGYKHCKKDIETLAEVENPDVICLQETKCEDSRLKVSGYTLISYSNPVITGTANSYGVAILIRNGLICEDIDLPMCWQGRICAIKIDRVVICNYYAVNTELNSKAKQVARSDFDSRLTDWLNSLDCKVILCGDLNVTSGSILIKKFEKYPMDYCKKGKNKPYPDRRWLFELLNNGWYDMFRFLHEDEISAVTFHSIRGRSSFRLDYFITNWYKGVSRCDILGQYSSDHNAIVLEY